MNGMMQLNEDPTPLSDVLESLKQDHPAYYRAWKSMTTTYGVDAVCTEWRGTAGLTRFIAEVSALPNSPTQLPGVKVKLKRKVSGFKFDAENTYWKLPSHMKAADRKKATHIDLSELPRSTAVVTMPSVNELKEKYPTLNDIERRMETLFELSMTNGLTSEESLELDVLGKLAISDDGSVPIPPASKYEDI